MVEHVLSADTAVPDQMHQITINNEKKTDFTALVQA